MGSAMKVTFHILMLFLCCSACTRIEEKSTGEDSMTKTEIPFDKTKWRKKEDRDYPYRNQMTEDLINNHRLKGLRRNEAIDLLATGPK
jgi:hypothetical protein